MVIIMVLNRYTIIQKFLVIKMFSRTVYFYSARINKKWHEIYIK